jgi:cation transport ATPase
MRARSRASRFRPRNGKASACSPGTINHSGVLDVRAESAGADTTLARIIHQVEEAQEARLPVQRPSSGSRRGTHRR